MKKLLVFFLLFASITSGLMAQNKTDNISLKKIQWNAGLTLSPQMLFVGGLDLGVYTNMEYHFSDNPLALLVGVDIRNKWLQLNMSTSGLDTRSLKTHYSVNVIVYGGVGCSFVSKDKQERNAFYIVGTPYLFSFKESVNTPSISNTAKSNSLNFNAGLLWSNAKITKKGRTINTQFYIPLFGKYLLDELRIMNFKIGFSI